ncbi:MAG: DUF6563 family protein [Flavobacterium sp.]
MSKMLSLSLLLFSTFLFSQNAIDYHEISLKNKKDISVEVNFYVDKVYDGRQFRENIGTVQKSIFNTKSLANFEKPFEVELQGYLSVVYPKGEGKQKVSIRVNELYISELTQATSETGYATLTIDVVEQIDNIDYIVGTYSSSIESNGLDVTNNHDERLKKGMKYCFDYYIATSKENKTALLFEPNQIVNKKIVSVPQKGIYFTYSDVLNNKPFDDYNYYVKNKKGKFYLVSKTSGFEKLNYYGFSDGQNFYINVSKYADSKYYAKTDIIGNKYYIEDVVYNPINVLETVAMFGGIVGAIVISEMGDAYAPMMVDCYSGQPIFLSNSEIKKMLSPYPELLKEFKKSKKENADKKNIMIKYFEQI